MVYQVDMKNGFSIPMKTGIQKIPFSWFPTSVGMVNVIAGAGFCPCPFPGDHKSRPYNLCYLTFI
ncbi:MAG: hypothetical protein JW967_07735 [Dehalococcoidales bacterium]|nr:hypothetical protein [Dehalococcoidales bacterium]